MTAVVTELVIDVLGTPCAQGSKKAFVRGGRAVLVEASPHLPKWRAAIVAATQARMRLQSWVTLDGPIGLLVDFYMPRPASVKPSQRHRPTVPPDGDKLLRAVADALTIAGAWVDDSRVVDWHAREFYARATCGARITITPLGDQGALL